MAESASTPNPSASAKKEETGPKVQKLFDTSMRETKTEEVIKEKESMQKLASIWGADEEGKTTDVKKNSKVSKGNSDLLNLFLTEDSKDAKKKEN
eukprot:403495-Amorphochlora_amoeboformis.AAC.1